MPENPTTMLKVRAVANLLNVHVSTVYRAIESGELHAVRIGSAKGAVRIPSTSLDAYLGRIGAVPAVAGEVA